MASLSDMNAGLDDSFLAYGEIFERAEINGEKLLNITRQKLKELGIIQTDHQDIILKAVANICKKDKVEEQDMQGEDQNDKKMPTRLRKQTEHLEHAIDRVLVMISERRRARSLHGTNEKPPHNILTAALELINMVKMILNILERPPFDCMSEFSSLKSHLIKLITLLKHFSEQKSLWEICLLESVKIRLLFLAKSLQILSGPNITLRKIRKY
ncbi:connector enhancer of kinase suppressor of ras 3-like [Lycaon pictus]